MTNARVSGKAGSDRRRADSPVSEAASGQSADEVYDDLKCETCGSPDCDEDNDILICDGCEKGFHQACAGVSTIPRGDWFCADCDEIRRAKSDRTGSKPSGRGRPRAAVAKDDADEEDVVTVTAAPEGVLSPGDIPNFETHLAALQRVLIDRCNGLHEARCDRGWWQKPLNDIVRLAEQTIVGGEGNSMALIGPRGSGKTAVR